MPHSLTELNLHTLRRAQGTGPTVRAVDLCVVGAGIAGVSAAIEAAQLGRRVVLVDALPTLGGQMVNSLIGLFCGIFGNAPERRQLVTGLVGAYPDAVISLSSELIQVSAVPEPQTWALLVGGLALVGAMARRRRG